LCSVCISSPAPPRACSSGASVSQLRVCSGDSLALPASPPGQRGQVSCGCCWSGVRRLSCSLKAIRLWAPHPLSIPNALTSLSWSSNLHPACPHSHSRCSKTQRAPPMADAPSGRSCVSFHLVPTFLTSYQTTRCPCIDKLPFMNTTQHSQSIGREE